MTNPQTNQNLENPLFLQLCDAEPPERVEAAFSLRSDAAIAATRSKSKGCAGIGLHQEPRGTAVQVLLYSRSQGRGEMDLPDPGLRLRTDPGVRLRRRASRSRACDERAIWSLLRFRLQRESCPHPQTWAGE